MSKRSKKKGSLLRLFLWALGVLVVALAVVAMYGWSWIEGYMKSPAFTQLLARQLGRATQSEVEIEPLTWTGSNVYGSRTTLTPTSGRGWKSVEAEGVQASLDFGAVRRGIWHVKRVDMDRLRIELGDSSAAPAETPVPAVEEAPSNIPSWLRSRIPSKTEIGDVVVQTFELVPAKGTAGVSLTDVKVKENTGSDEGAWLLRGEGGKLAIPGLTEPFRLTSISCRLDAKALNINDTIARWKGDSEVTAQGELPFDKAKGWKFSGHFSNLDLRQLLSVTWNQKLSGVLEGDYNLSSQPASDLLFKSTVALKSGVIQGMPVLDRIADFTRTDRFRRVVLDQATGDVEKQGDFTKLSNLVLQSNGLLRIEGGLTIREGNVLGSFLVGVSPETLRWIPGAQGHVFTQNRTSGPPGFVWTTVNITGTVDSVREDLSNRLLAAAGKALIESPLNAAGKGVELLGSGGEAVLQGSKTIIDGGKDAVRGATGVLEKGVEAGAGLLKGLLPR